MDLFLQGGLKWQRIACGRTLENTGSVFNTLPLDHTSTHAVYCIFYIPTYLYSCYGVGDRTGIGQVTDLPIHHRANTQTFLQTDSHLWTPVSHLCRP